MPFENYNDGRIGVVLGTGDIAVSTGALVKSLEGEENIAATPIAAEHPPKRQILDRLFFSQQATRPMGEPTGLEGQRSDEFKWDVCLLFENTAAVDVVMEKLEEIRRSMLTAPEILKNLKRQIDDLNAKPSAILALSGFLTRQPGFNPLNATISETKHYVGAVPPDDGGQFSGLGINIPEERKGTTLAEMRAQETASMEMKMLAEISVQSQHAAHQEVVADLVDRCKRLLARCEQSDATADRLRKYKAELETTITDNDLRVRASPQKSQATRYFLDTEFMESGPGSPIHLISLGIVSEDGKREFYAELEDAPLASANDWVRDNVIPKLTGPRMSRRAIAGGLIDMFRGTDPQFWAYFGAYDWELCTESYREATAPRKEVALSGSTLSQSHHSFVTDG